MVGSAGKVAIVISLIVVSFGFGFYCYDILYNSSLNSNTTRDGHKQNKFSLGSIINFSFGNSKSKPNKPATTSDEVIKCGRVLTTNDYRITSGRPSSIAEFPWIVSLQRERSYWFGFNAFFHSCGGSVITASWIITAAHCLYNKDDNIRIIAGTDNLNFLYKAQTRSVGDIMIHPDFDIVSFENDIALIKLDEPLNLESTFSRVVPICIERDIPLLTYDIATVSGFGSPAFNQRSRSHLYSTNIAIIDHSFCNESYGGGISDDMVCAGGMVPGKHDACSGDSGGPLQLEVEDHRSLIGIVSFGSSCASEYPGVYTRVSNYYYWITDNIDEQLYEPY